MTREELALLTDVDDVYKSGVIHMISESVSCPHCGRKLNSYTVEYGKGKIKITKN